PVAEQEPPAGPLLVIDVAAAEEDRGAGAQGAVVGGVAGGRQGREVAVLDPPQQGLRPAPQPAWLRVVLFARTAETLMAETGAWWILRGGSELAGPGKPPGGSELAGLRRLTGGARRPACRPLPPAPADQQPRHAVRPGAARDVLDGRRWRQAGD